MECVRQLMGRPGLTVLLGGRSVERGKEVVRELNAENVGFLHIDLDDEGTIEAAAKFVKDTFGGLDILINNAATAFKGDAWGEHVAVQTFKTNYYGTKTMCTHFLPLLRPHGRLVNVSSLTGHLHILQSPSLRQLFESPTLTLPQLDALVQDFITSVKDNTYAHKGYPKTCYGMSKLALNCYSKCLMREYGGRDDILMNCVCPGYCATSLSSFHGHRTPAKGAETPVWLALIPPNTPFKQAFYTDEKEIPW
uniref:Uncharacterized protein n=1 Tax=Arcella intermedia TaxID=1963864 RepID=A0A6B2LED2_9EUKA